MEHNEDRNHAGRRGTLSRGPVKVTTRIEPLIKPETTQTRDFEAKSFLSARFRAQRGVGASFGSFRGKTSGRLGKKTLP